MLQVGHRAQIDLFDMGPLVINGEQFILHYIDRLSGFSHVHTLKSKATEEVGVELIQILSTTVIPKILQLDHGNEFLGKCIEMIQLFTHTYIL